MANFELRPATAEDFPAIRALIRAARINPTGLYWKRFVVAVKADGELIGCGQIKRHEDQSHELASLAVKPVHRRQGVARAIIEQLLDGSPRPLYLMCRARLGSLYEKFGFRATKQEEMPTYFRRISRLAGVFNALAKINDTLLIMRLD